MAFSTTTTEILYTGDGADVTFSIPFSFIDDSAIHVELYDYSDASSPSLIEELVEDTDYTISGTVVTMVVPPALTERLRIYRETDDIHSTTYSGYQFPYATVNDDFDRVFQRLQEVKASIEALVSGTQISFGDQSVDNSFRIRMSGTSLLIEKRILGEWVALDELN